MRLTGKYLIKALSSYSFPKTDLTFEANGETYVGIQSLYTYDGSVASYTFSYI
jgi:hypothetical protein